MMTIGRYELRGKIGGGGYATVYRVWDTMLGREVALKLLLPYLAEDGEVRQRFIAEARALARLRHPNIVSVYDVGEWESRPFFVMELIDGLTLTEMLVPHEELDAGWVVGILYNLCDAVDFLHDAGLVHRDIKASNVMFDTGGRVVLMDLGVALTVEQAREADTSAIVGTVEYIAPEYLLGRPVGPASDIYALGVLAYQLLAGRPPFRGDAVRVLYGHAHETPPPLRLRRPGLPEPVYATIDAALAKDPLQRPPSARAFAAGISGGMTRTRGGSTRTAPANGRAATAAAQRATAAAAAAPPAVAAVAPAPAVSSVPRPTEDVRPTPRPPSAAGDSFRTDPGESVSSPRSSAAPRPGTTTLQFSAPRAAPPLPPPPPSEPRRGPLLPRERPSSSPSLGDSQVAANPATWLLIVGALIILGILVFQVRSGDGASDQSALPAGRPGATAQSRQGSGPLPVVSDLKVFQSVVSRREDDFEVGESVAVCFNIKPVNDAQPLVVVITPERAPLPESATDAAVAARSEPVPQRAIGSCYEVRVLQPPLPAGRYLVSVMFGANRLNVRGFTARAGPGGTLITDTFDDPNGNVLPPQSSDPGRYRRGYENGEYVIQIFGTGGAVDATAPLVGVYGDTTFSVDARLIGDPNGRYLALTCRRNLTAVDGYEFWVAPGDGSFGLKRWDSGREVILIAARQSPAIRRSNAPNRIEMTCAGNSISASVNGVQVATTQDATYKSGRLALKAGAARDDQAAEIRFDNLLVVQR